MDIADMILYHGSASDSVVPTFGLGNDHHDYGRGFYLTDDLDLAREWAVCRPEESNGWVHAYRLKGSDLKVLDFQQQGVLAWMAELMMLGGLGMQYCLKSERDRQARDRMDELIAGPRNAAIKVMSTLV